MTSLQSPIALEAPYDLQYTYKRSLGPVLSRFFTGLRDGRIEGVRTATGRVIVPPVEYDPDTGDDIAGWQAVGDAGVVRTWAWVIEPLPSHPLQRPFAWALIQLDGADTSLLHAIDAGKADAMKTGMRVKVRWAESRGGSIHDIACFVPE